MSFTAICPNCKQSITSGGHYVHPSMGDEGFYACPHVPEQPRDHAREAATDNYSTPTAEMLTDPVWNAIWNEIKEWDINVPAHYVGYCRAEGNHVTAIYKVVTRAIEQATAADKAEVAKLKERLIPALLKRCNAAEQENKRLREALKTAIAPYDELPEKVLAEIAPEWLPEARATLARPEGK